MWAKFMYLIPVAAILSQYETPNEIKMEGDLVTELDRLLRFANCPSNLKLTKTKLKCRIDATYPKGTNVWTIFDTILQRYHLVAFVESDGEDSIRLSLKEGAAWSSFG